MTEFLDWAMVGTVAGFVLAVVLLTEFVKNIPFLKTVPTQIVSFVIAMVVMLAYKFAMSEFKWVDFLLYVLNSVGASLTANGGYAAIKRIAEPFLPAPKEDQTDV